MPQLREVSVELQMALVRTSVVMQFGPRLFNAEGELRDPTWWSARQAACSTICHGGRSHRERRTADGKPDVARP